MLSVDVRIMLAVRAITVRSVASATAFVSSVSAATYMSILSTMKFSADEVLMSVSVSSALANGEKLLDIVVNDEESSNVMAKIEISNKLVCL
jgi:hypothetical protein